MSNASGTMVRKASELDVGSKVIVGGAIHAVARVYDHGDHDGRYTHVGIVFDHGGCIIDRVSTLYTCIAQCPE